VEGHAPSWPREQVWKGRLRGTSPEIGRRSSLRKLFLRFLILKGSNVNSRRRNLRNASAPNRPTPTGVERTWQDHRAGITPFDPLGVVRWHGRLVRRFRLRLFTFVPVRNARDSLVANPMRLLGGTCSRPLALSPHCFSLFPISGDAPPARRNDTRHLTAPALALECAIWLGQQTATWTGQHRDDL